MLRVFPRSGLAGSFTGLMTLLSLLPPTAVFAGPPYTTDDPEPVEYRHWEVYLASQGFWAAGQGPSGTLPQVEVNYGAVPDLQLHAIVPLAWARPPGERIRFGPGDVELGAKLRFVREGSWVPQVGTFPLLELPAGDASRGLGAGYVQLFVPVWFQKSFGRWTTYGGGGYWINPGPGNLNWWYVGWQAQFQVADRLSIGAEVFHATVRQQGASGESRFNVGMVLDISDLQHLLVSAGHGLGSEVAQAYLAYQLTFGPEK